MHLRLPLRDCPGPSRTSPGGRRERSVCEEAFFYFISFISFTVRTRWRGFSNRMVTPTWGSLRPLESESEVSLYWDEAISTSVEALLRFFKGLQASEISLAPGISHETLEDYAKRWQQQHSCLYEMHVLPTFLGTRSQSSLGGKLSLWLVEKADILISMLLQW